MSAPLVDLHCHILPGIDDGAKDIDTTAEMLRRELADGVIAVMFTPHFHYERDDIESFAERRKRAYRATAAAAKERDLKIAAKLGAEVYFTSALPSLDLKTLAFSGTNYILIELPTTHHPSGVEEVLYGVQQKGYRPIIAHVERYPYVTDDPTLLYDWVSEGALAHINAAPIIRGGKTVKLLHKYIEWGLVHFLCSDAHSPDKRPPNLGEAYKLLDPDISEQFRKNAESIYLGRNVDAFEPEKPRLRFGKWV